jgi:hypothetical protein
MSLKDGTWRQHQQQAQQLKRQRDTAMLGVPSSDSLTLMSLKDGTWKQQQQQQMRHLQRQKLCAFWCKFGCCNSEHSDAAA